MNGYTREIAVLLDCSVTQAQRVQDAIDDDWALDYSECSQEEFNAAAREYGKKVLG